MFKVATFKEFKVNDTLYEHTLLCGFVSVHWEYDEYSKEYMLVNDIDGNTLYPPHSTTLKGLFDSHRIYIDEKSIVELFDIE